jgi:hypothetical protein
MTRRQEIPAGVPVSVDIEYRADRPKPYCARVPWNDPSTGRRRSVSKSFKEQPDAQAWLAEIRRKAAGGIDPALATMTLADDASVPVHVLQKTAGHGLTTTTQRCLHPDRRSIQDAGNALNDFLTGDWSPNGPQTEEEEADGS